MSEYSDEEIIRILKEREEIVRILKERLENSEKARKEAEGKLSSRGHGGNYHVKLPYEEYIQHFAEQLPVRRTRKSNPTGTYQAAQISQGVYFISQFIIWAVAKGDIVIDDRITP